MPNAIGTGLEQRTRTNQVLRIGLAAAVFVIVGGIVAYYAFISAPPTSTQVPVYACEDAGTPNQPMKLGLADNSPVLYKLENNVTAKNGTCFNVVHDNVVIDLNGKEIKYGTGFVRHAHGIVAQACDDPNHITGTPCADRTAGESFANLFVYNSQAAAATPQVAKITEQFQTTPTALCAVAGNETAACTGQNFYDAGGHLVGTLSDTVTIPSGASRLFAVVSGTNITVDPMATDQISAFVGTGTAPTFPTLPTTANAKVRLTAPADKSTFANGFQTVSVSFDFTLPAGQTSSLLSLRIYALTTACVQNTVGGQDAALSGNCDAVYIGRSMDGGQPGDTTATVANLNITTGGLDTSGIAADGTRGAITVDSNVINVTGGPSATGTDLRSAGVKIINSLPTADPDTITGNTVTSLQAGIVDDTPGSIIGAAVAGATKANPIRSNTITTNPYYPDGSTLDPFSYCIIARGSNSIVENNGCQNNNGILIGRVVSPTTVVAADNQTANVQVKNNGVTVLSPGSTPSNYFSNPPPATNFTCGNGMVGIYLAGSAQAATVTDNTVTATSYWCNAAALRIDGRAAYNLNHQINTNILKGRWADDDSVDIAFTDNAAYENWIATAWPGIPWHYVDRLAVPVYLDGILDPSGVSFSGNTASGDTAGAIYVGPNGASGINYTVAAAGFGSVNRSAQFPPAPSCPGVDQTRCTQYQSKLTNWHSTATSPQYSAWRAIKFTNTTGRDSITNTIINPLFGPDAAATYEGGAGPYELFTGWTITFTAKDQNGGPLSGVTIVSTDRLGTVRTLGITDNTGALVVTMNQKKIANAGAVDFNNYSITGTDSKGHAQTVTGVVIDSQKTIPFAANFPMIGNSTITTKIMNAANADLTNGSAPAGTVVHAQATVGGSGSTPTGTVAFTRFPTSDCSGTSSATDTKSLASGIASSAPFTTASTGTLSYLAQYSGDTVYNPTSACVATTITAAASGNTNTGTNGNTNAGTNLNGNTNTSVNTNTALNTNSALNTNGGTGGTGSDTVAPTVVLIQPATGVKVAKSNIVLAAVASDNRGVAGVAFYVDNQYLTTATKAPYTATWDASAASGTHILWAKAYDDAGNIALSNIATVSVVEGTVPVSVTMTSPIPSWRYIISTQILGAAVNGGTEVVSVKFYRDNGIFVGTSTTPPYSLKTDVSKWKVGAHTIYAVATVNNNGTTQTINSARVTKTVVPNWISHIAPKQNARIKGTAVVFQAKTVGSMRLKRVQYLIDGKRSIGTSSRAPYTVRWNSKVLKNGPHLVTYRVIDARKKPVAWMSIIVNIRN